MAVEFEKAITDPQVAAMLALPYQQARQRLHVIKQQFDDLSSTPGTYLMPLAIATNTATRLTARCQIDVTKPPPPSPSAAGAAPVPSAMKAWLAEMEAFPAAVDAAVVSLNSWAKACPKDRFSIRTPQDCANFAAQVKAWMCGTAVLGRMKLSSC